MTLEYPCESCIHNEVCGLKTCIEETEVKTTHPYFLVKIACAKYSEKPTPRERK